MEELRTMGRLDPCEHRSTLYIFSGLPCVGKTTLARRLSNYLGATFLRIDTVEQGLRDLLNCDVTSEGYRLSYRIAEDNLCVGVSVVADSCNPIALTRSEWEATAKRANADLMNIEVLCSCSKEHRQRIETRTCNIENLRLPTWNEVKNKEYQDWDRPRLVIDTSGESEEESFASLLEAIQQAQNDGSGYSHS